MRSSKQASGDSPVNAVSDAGLIPPALTDDQWRDHLHAYWERIQQALRDSERPIETEIIPGEVWGHTLTFPYGPFIGDYAIPPTPADPQASTHAGYEVGADSENENPGYRMRPYLIASDPHEPPLALPYGFSEGDAREAAARIITWVLAHR